VHKNTQDQAEISTEIHKESVTVSRPAMPSPSTQRHTFTCIRAQFPLPTRKGSQKKYDTVMQNAQAWCRPLLTLRPGFTNDTQGNAPFQHPTKSRWGLYIVCVGNRAGFDTFDHKEMTKNGFLHCPKTAHKS